MTEATLGALVTRKGASNYEGKEVVVSDDHTRRRKRRKAIKGFEKVTCLLRRWIF